MIRLSARRGGYTVLDNSLFSAGLSFRAMGLLAYLLSKPDNWQVSVSQLVEQVANSSHPDGRDAVYAVLAELRAAGFIERTRLQDADGRMAGYRYRVLVGQEQAA